MVDTIRHSYYQNANLVLPPRFAEARGGVSDDKIESNILASDVVLSRPDRNKKFKRNGESCIFGKWEAYRHGESSVIPSVVVARNPRYPGQRIITPRHRVEEFMFGFYLLDCMYPNNNFRDCDIVVSSRRNPNSGKIFPYELPKRGRYFSEKILKQTGIFQNLRSGGYETPDGSSPIGLRIASKLEWPVIFFPEQPNSFGYNVVYFMSSIIHELTHRQQSIKNLDSFSTSSIELQALNNGYNFVLLLQHTPFYKSLTQREKFLINLFLKRGDKYVTSFRTGGNGHIMAEMNTCKSSPNPYLPHNLFVYNKPLTL